MTDDADHDGEIRLPPKTTPTWEVELLVSGATVFGLAQLPPLADRVLSGCSTWPRPRSAGW
jgi:hypothetical protein